MKDTTQLKEAIETLLKYCLMHGTSGIDGEFVVGGSSILYEVQFATTKEQLAQIHMDKVEEDVERAKRIRRQS